MNKVLITVVIITLGVLIYGFTSSQKKVENIAFLDNNVLYSNFDGTKEMTKDVLQQLIPMRNEIDSLEVVVQSIEAKISEGLFTDVQHYRKVRNELESKVEKYQINDQELSNDVFTKVWTYLNDYITEYGDMEEYTLILGASGNGNIMYGNETADITTDLLNYANSKYNGN